MYFILSIFYKLVIHQLSLTIVVINKHQINRGWSKVVSIFIFSVFLYVELVLTAFGKCPALAGLQFVGYFLNTFHVSRLEIPDSDEDHRLSVFHSNLHASGIPQDGLSFWKDLHAICFLSHFQESQDLCCMN